MTSGVYRDLHEEIEPRFTAYGIPREASPIADIEAARRWYMGVYFDFLLLLVRYVQYGRCNFRASEHGDTITVDRLPDSQT
jgi:hypothetical protein